jgi:hypothetical protein
MKTLTAVETVVPAVRRIDLTADQRLPFVFGLKSTITCGTWLRDRRICSPAHGGDLLIRVSCGNKAQDHFRNQPAQMSRIAVSVLRPTLGIATRTGRHILPKGRDFTSRPLI